MRLRKLSSLTTALTLLLATAIPSVTAFGASDLDGHWAQAEIEVLQASGIIQGYPDGTFRPENPISRAEFVTILNRAAQLDAVASAGRFIDVDPDTWFDGQVGLASAIGYINGFEDNTFRPNQPITRSEVAVILARALGLTQTGTPPFSDGAEIPQWAAPSVAAVAAAGYMKGYPDGSFGGDRQVTRAEASVLIYRSQAALVSQVPRLQTVSVTDESGNPVPKAVVRVHRQGQKKFVASQETDAKGQAIFALRPNRYEITVSTPDHVGHQAYTVPFAHGQVQISVQKAAVLTGRLVDENGQPMAGVVVTFTTNPTFITTTDVNGQYRIPVLPNREYEVSVFNSIEELREPDGPHYGTGAGSDVGSGMPAGDTGDSQGLSVGAYSAPAAGEIADVGEATVVTETGEPEEPTSEQPTPEQPGEPEEPQEPGTGEQPAEEPTEPELASEEPPRTGGGGGGSSVRKVKAIIVKAEGDVPAITTRGGTLQNRGDHPFERH